MEAIGGISLLGLPLAFGAWLAARGAWPTRPALDRLLAAIILGWGWLTLGMQGLGSFGLIGRMPLGAWSILGLSLGYLISRWGATREEAGTGPRLSGGSVGPFGSSSLLALGLTLAVCLFLVVLSLGGPVKVVSDGPIYHLYFAVRWWKAGGLELVAVPFGESAATYFPANGDLWFTWLLTGWGSDRLARAGQGPFLLLTGLAVFALARRLEAGRGASLLAACWVVTSTPLLVFSFEANVDTLFVAGYVLAAYAFLVWRIDEGGRFGLLLAGLAAGLAWGTKPTGTVFIPPLIMLMGAGILARGGRRWLCRWGDLGVLLAATLTPCGFWFGRNAWLTGNPLYPADLSAVGWVGWFEREAMRYSPYYLPVTDVGSLADIVMAAVDPRLMLVWLPALAGAWRLGTLRRMNDGWVWIAAGLAVLNLALYWLVIPYRTQQRFFLQGLALGAIPLARLFERRAWLRWLGAGVLALHVLTPQGWLVADEMERLPWELSRFVPSNVPSPLPIVARGPILWLAVYALFAGLLLAGGVAWAQRRPKFLRFTAIGAACGVALLGGLGLLRLGDRPTIRGEREIYPPFRDYWAGWHRLDKLAGDEGATVAYAGTDIPYYLFGRHLRNNVRYVNVNEHSGWLMHDYHAASVAAGAPHWPDPRPGWDRLVQDREAWLANLRQAGVELLVVTRADPEEGRHLPAPGDRLGFPIERTWAESAPDDFEPIYGVVEQDPRFRIYRLREKAPVPRR